MFRRHLPFCSFSHGTWSARAKPAQNQMIYQGVPNNIVDGSNSKVSVTVHYVTKKCGLGRTDEQRTDFPSTKRRKRKVWAKKNGWGTDWFSTKKMENRMKKDGTIFNQPKKKNEAKVWAKNGWGADWFSIKKCKSDDGRTNRFSINRNWHASFQMKRKRAML